MKERFEGNNRHNLIDALKRQEFVAGDGAVAEAMAKEGELVEFQKLDTLIFQDAEDSDIYLLLAGSVSIIIKGNEYRSRVVGQHVGEMAAIEPTLKRSATVLANETVVALKLSSSAFMEMGKTFPQIWLPMAQELSRRLHQRNSMIQPPNEFPKLFIISSSEALPVAKEIRKQLEHDVFSTVWTDGVFWRNLCVRAGTGCWECRKCGTALAGVRCECAYRRNIEGVFQPPIAMMTDSGTPARRAALAAERRKSWGISPTYLRAPPPL
jgi:CRP/FNR family transcriptional regulator, cyclic AMP receptor protein